MRRQKCSQCGTMLDVSKLDKGSKFACANCGAILVVGEAAVVKRSLRDPGPAFERTSKRADKSTTGKSKAGKAAATPAHPRRSREPAAPSSGSKMPLVLGVGVLVVAAIVGAVLFGGDTGGGADGPTAAEWWQAKEAGLADADAATLRGWIAEAKAKGYDRDAAFWGPRSDRIYKALLAKDPTSKEANTATGRQSLRDYPDFAKVWLDMNDNFRSLSKEQKAFLDEYTERVDAPGKKPVYLDAAKWAAAKKILDEYVASRGADAANPARGKIEKSIAEATAILGKVGAQSYGFVPVVEGPFILLLAYLKDANEEAVRAELETKGKHYAAALAIFHKRFEQTFREPLELPAIEPGRYFVHLVVAREADLRRFLHAGEGFDAAGDIPAYWSPRTKWSHVYVNPDLASHAAGDLAHEAVHQLHWYYSRDKKLKALYHMDKWNGLWFTEGWAEYAGGMSFTPGAGTAKHTGAPKRRTEHLQRMRDNGLPLLSVRDLVQFDNMDTFQRTARDALRAATGDVAGHGEAAGAILAEPGFLVKTFYAQAWLLAHFMNHHENGKYKAKYLDLVRSALTGRRKPEQYRKDKSVAERFGSAYDAFAEIMGLKTPADWQRLDAEYKRHLPIALRAGG